jgi:hypothetical protein
VFFEQPGMLPSSALDKLVTELRKLDMGEVRRKLSEQQPAR